MMTQLLGVRIFEIEPSSRCNLHCRFCNRQLLPDAGLMSRETFERFLEHTPLKGTDSIAFVGIGEPLLNPLLPEFIGMVKERCSKTHTLVTTNGALLTPATLQALLDAGLDTLDVSFNGTTSAEYESLHCGASFRHTIENVDQALALISSTGSRTDLQINFILTEENLAREEDIKNFWRVRGVRQFRVQRMHNRGGTLAVGGMTPPDGPGLEGEPCQMFEILPFISWRGDVFPCSHDVRREHPVGNICREPWEVIARRRKAIASKGDWPAMCRECRDPQRHSLRASIDGEAAREAARLVFSGPRRAVRHAARCAFGAKGPRKVECSPAMGVVGMSISGGGL